MKMINPALRKRSQELRKRMTEPEKKLWFEYLRKLPVVVHRQKVINCFIVDFYIASRKLVIEVDGESHFTEDGGVYDTERTTILEGMGLQVLRVTNREVMHNFSGVCAKVDAILSISPSLSS